MNNQKGPPIEIQRMGNILIVMGAMLIFVLVAAACGPAQTPTAAPTQPPAEPPPAPTPTEVQPVDAPAALVPAPVEEEAEPEPEPVAIDPAQIQLIQALWEGSPHGNTYDLGKGPNTYCSRCHSPQNWDPEAMPGTPPNCITCKFATDPELRIAETMDFVAEEDWAGITCNTCHKTEGGVLVPELAWLNPLTNEHEPVNTPSELCQKCHLTTSGVKASGGRGVTHEIVLGGSAHANWAGALPQTDRPQYCSDCHDPHSTEPKQCVACHDDVLTLDTHIKGNAEAHANVSCLACHDASGMLVGPHPDPNQNGVWTTLVSSVSRSGEMTTAYEKSHSIQWQVACSRCHFEDNPYELIVLTADGKPPAPPAAP